MGKTFKDKETYNPKSKSKKKGKKDIKIKKMKESDE